MAVLIICNASSKFSVACNLKLLEFHIYSLFDKYHAMHVWKQIWYIFKEVRMLSNSTFASTRFLYKWSEQIVLNLYIIFVFISRRRQISPQNQLRRSLRAGLPCQYKIFSYPQTNDRTGETSVYTLIYCSKVKLL